MSAVIDELALAHKRAIVNLATLTDQDILRIWKMVSGASPDAIRNALLEVVPELSSRYGEMAGALASDFYDDVRLEASARGAFVAEPAPLPGSARAEALVRWGVDPLYAAVPDESLAFSLITGGLQRIVANQARQTIEMAAQADPAAHGWRRVTSADSCRFCRMLAGRGAVYKDSTVRFASHDDCHCAAAPAFSPGRPLDVHQYVASKRTQTAEDRARTREFMSSSGSDKGRSPSQSKRTDGFNAMTRQQVEKQISILEGLKDSDYRTSQLAKLRARLAALS